MVSGAVNTFSTRNNVVFHSAILGHGQVQISLVTADPLRHSEPVMAAWLQGEFQWLRPPVGAQG